MKFLNKLRSIRIFELRGLIHPIEQYVIDLLDGIEEVLDGDSIRYKRYKKDGKIYFTYYLINNDIVLSYHLENDFITKFICSYEEIREAFKTKN